MLIKFDSNKTHWRYLSITEGHSLIMTLRDDRDKEFGETSIRKDWKNIAESRRVKIMELVKEVERLAEEIRQSL